MEQTQLQEQIAKYYSNLPTDLQQVFSSMTWMDVLRNISAKYKLNEKQIQTLGAETTLVLLGIVHPDEYASSLKNEMAMDDINFKTMLGEINTSILGSFRQQLVIAYTKHVESVAEIDNEVVDERFNLLPNEVKEAVLSSDYQKKLYEIGTNNKLPINKMAILEDITVRLITAKISPKEYEGELAAKMELPVEKVSEIVNQVNEQVLKNIRLIMQKNQEVPQASSDDEVPIPPYADKMKPEIPIPAPMKIEIPVAVPTPISKTESDIYSDAGIEVISGVGNVENDSIRNIIGSKLRSTTISSKVISDHTLPKVSAGNQVQATAPISAPQAQTSNKAYDPYHEAIN